MVRLQLQHVFALAIERTTCTLNKGEINPTQAGIPESMNHSCKIESPSLEQSSRARTSRLSLQVPSRCVEK